MILIKIGNHIRVISMNDKNRVLFYRPGNREYGIELEVFSGDDDYPGLLRWVLVIDESPHPYRNILKYDSWVSKFRWMEDWHRNKV